MAALEQVPGAAFKMATPYQRALQAVPDQPRGSDGRVVNPRRTQPAPLRLGYIKAVEQACKLRALGLSYKMIAAVMIEYHGVHRSDGWWAAKIRAAGGPERRRGGPGGVHELKRGSKPRYPELRDRPWLMANQHRRTVDIAAQLGCVPTTVNKAFRREGIRR